jgi:transcriptional regulator with XRE-family HTH domain
MSAQDRELLIKAGLTATKVAELMGKTRQAISKGLAGDRAYFDPTDLAELREAVAQQLPGKRLLLEKAIGDMFDSLAGRLGGGGPSRDVVAAIGAAERAWLIFPRFAASSMEQARAYEAVFEAIEARQPPTSLDAPPSDDLEITVYCDRDRADIERKFHLSWFDQRQIAIIECDVVDKMTPTIILDPHNDDGNLCFGLVEKGFQPLARGEAAALIKAFAAHVSEKMRQAEPMRLGRPIDARRLPVKQVLVEKI